MEIQKESNRNPTRDKSEDHDFQGYQSFVDSLEGRMSLTLKNSKSAMPSMKSLMFKEEEFTIGFWPGCQAPDLKEVPNFSAIFHLFWTFLKDLS